MSSSFVMSAWMATTVPPLSFSSSARASSSPFPSRALIATLTPSRRNCRALSFPMPRLPPVTIALRPFIPKSMTSLSLLETRPFLDRTDNWSPVLSRTESIAPNGRDNSKVGMLGKRVARIALRMNSRSLRRSPPRRQLDKATLRAIVLWRKAEAELCATAAGRRLGAEERSAPPMARSL